MKRMKRPQVLNSGPQVDTGDGLKRLTNKRQGSQNREKVCKNRLL